MKVRLNKALTGIAARRKADQLILNGKVMVNGSVVKKPQHMVDESDTVTVDDKPVKVQKKLYFVMHKPRGFECTHRTPVGKKVIYDLINEPNTRLFSVGRLDKDSTGLLILTNDGDFANEVIHPSANLSKDYLVRTDKEITHEHLVALGKGCEVEGTFVRPVKVKKVRKNIVKIAVKEGKKREVRVLVKAAGLNVLELKRIRIGGLQLGNMAEGEIRPLSKKMRLTIFN